MASSDTAKQDPPTPLETPLDEADIADYLRRQPDYLLRHPELLDELQLVAPTPEDDNAGQVVQLADHRIHALQQNNTELRRRLGELLATAKANEQLFQSVRRIALSLIEAGDLEDFNTRMHERCREDLQVDTCSLLVFDAPEAQETPLRGAPEAQARAALPQLFEEQHALCGALSEAALEFLFPANREIGSAAIAPLCGRGGKILGVLALGSKDPEHFQTNMDTLFLSYLGEVAGRLLPPAMPDPQSRDATLPPSS